MSRATLDVLPVLGYLASSINQDRCGTADSPLSIFHPCGNKSLGDSCLSICDAAAHEVTATIPQVCSGQLFLILLHTRPGLELLQVPLLSFSIFHPVSTKTMSEYDNIWMDLLNTQMNLNITAFKYI